MALGEKKKKDFIYVKCVFFLHLRKHAAEKKYFGACVCVSMCVFVCEQLDMTQVLS